MPEMTKRYLVMTMATEAPFDFTDIDGVFVLKPWKDPAALRALAAYRQNCYPELARDLEAWIRAIQAGAKVRGDVGRRNEPHVKKGHGEVGTKRKSRVSGPRASRTGHPRSKPASRHSRQKRRRKRRR